MDTKFILSILVSAKMNKGILKNYSFKLVSTVNNKLCSAFNQYSSHNAVQWNFINFDFHWYDLSLIVSQLHPWPWSCRKMLKVCGCCNCVCLCPCQKSHKLCFSTLLMYAHSEVRSAPNNQKGAVTDQDQDWLTAGKTGEDWAATSLWRR